MEFTYQLQKNGCWARSELKSMSPNYQNYVWLPIGIHLDVRWQIASAGPMKKKTVFCSCTWPPSHTVRILVPRAIFTRKDACGREALGTRVTRCAGKSLEFKKRPWERGCLGTRLPGNEDGRLQLVSIELDLLQVSLSLSYRSTMVYITWRSTERRSEKERLVNFGKSRFKTEPKMQDLL